MTHDPWPTPQHQTPPSWSARGSLGREEGTERMEGPKMVRICEREILERSTHSKNSQPQAGHTSVIHRLKLKRFSQISGIKQLFRNAY